MHNVTPYWNKAISLEEYLRDIDNAIAGNTNPEYTPFYELNKKRIERLLKTYQPSEEQKLLLQSKEFKGKVLIISEGWCGDAAQSVPVVYKFFSPVGEVKIIYRDTNNLIDSYLTNGAKSIPVVLLLNESNDVVAQWGPRPAYGDELLKKFKTDPSEYPKEQFLQDLQVAYNKDKGNAIANELLSLL